MDGSRRRAVAGRLAALALALAALGAPTASAAVPQPDCNTIWQRAGSGFYEDNPTYVDPRDDTADWQFATPASQNLNGALIDAGVDSMAGNPTLYSVLVLRHGKLVYERYLNGSARNHSNAIHSASKSILQALLGIAVGRGEIRSLDDPVSSYVPQYFRNASAAKRAITIRQMISMSSGLKWHEDVTEKNIESRADWVQAILDLQLQNTPGTVFNYSTGNTHVLSAVLQAATGRSTCEYAAQQLFTHIGITAEHWGRDPQGIYSGGYNVHLTPRELAKFGQLYLNDGIWDGVRRVPHQAVLDAQRLMWVQDPIYSYSHGWWLASVSGHPIHFAFGWGGQNAYVIPSLDMVLVMTQRTTAGYALDEIQPLLPGGFAEQYLIPAVTGP